WAVNHNLTIAAALSRLADFIAGARFGKMAASRLIILGVAAAAAGGAGYVAKQMTASPSLPPIVVDSAPQKPSIALSEVLVLTENVPVGGVLDGQMRWQSWPTASIDENYITRDKDAEAITKLKGEVARIAMYN